MEATADAGVTYPKVVEALRSNGLDLTEIGRVTGVQLRQVQHWLAGTSKPSNDTQARLLDLHYVINLLTEVYRPEGVDIWLHGRQRALRGERPIDLLETGNFEPVITLVEQLAGGFLD